MPFFIWDFNFRILNDISYCYIMMILSSIMFLKVNNIFLLPRSILNLNPNLMQRILIRNYSITGKHRNLPCKSINLTSIRSFDNCPVSNEFLTANTSSWIDSCASTREIFLSGVSKLEVCSDKSNSDSLIATFSFESNLAAANLDAVWFFSIIWVSSGLTYFD